MFLPAGADVRHSLCLKRHHRRGSRCRPRRRIDAARLLRRATPGRGFPLDLALRDVLNILIEKLVVRQLQKAVGENFELGGLEEDLLEDDAQDDSTLGRA